MPLLAVFLLQRTAVGICSSRCVLGNFHGGECFLGEASKILFQRCALGRQMDVCVTVPAAERRCFPVRLNYFSRTFQRTNIVFLSQQISISISISQISGHASYLFLADTSL